MMKGAFRYLAFLLIFAGGRTVAMATSLQAVRENNDAIEELKNERPYNAYKKLLQALNHDPFNHSIRLNLGLAFEGNEEHEKARQEYLAVAKQAEDPALRFAGWFNAARVSAHQNDIESALAYYQAALEIDPNSKEVRTNIELLWQMQQGQGGGQGQQQQNDPKGGGQNKGDNQQKDPSKDESEQNEPSQDSSQKSGSEPEKKRQPRPFDSRELTKDDVRKILDEIKNQEQSIRASELEKKVKEAPRDKNW